MILDFFVILVVVKNLYKLGIFVIFYVIPIIENNKAKKIEIEI